MKEGYILANEYVREFETKQLKVLIQAVNYWSERVEDAPKTFMPQLEEARQKLKEELERLGKDTSKDYLDDSQEEG